MPGADQMVKTGEDEYQIKMKLLIASLSGKFEGKVKLTEPNPPHSFRMRVDGNGKIGFMKGEGVIDLVPRQRWNKSGLRRRRPTRWYDCRSRSAAGGYNIKDDAQALLRQALGDRSDRVIERLPATDRTSLAFAHTTNGSRVF